MVVRPNYAILRFRRLYNPQSIRSANTHNNRKKFLPHINEDGPAPIELLEGASGDLNKDLKAKLKELDLVINKGRNIGVEFVATASPAHFKSDEDIAKFYAAVKRWAKARFGKALISLKAHEDEKTPHVHGVVLAALETTEGKRGPKPKTDAGKAKRAREGDLHPVAWRFSYNKLMGGSRERLSHEQDVFHEAVAHLGLARGEKALDDQDFVLEGGLVVRNRWVPGYEDPDTTKPGRPHMTGKAYLDRAREQDRESELKLNAATQAEARAKELERQAEQRVQGLHDRERSIAERAAEVERLEAGITMERQLLDDDKAADRARRAAEEASRAEARREEDALRYDQDVARAIDQEMFDRRVRHQQEDLAAKEAKLERALQDAEAAQSSAEGDLQQAATDEVAAQVASEAAAMERKDVEARKEQLQGEHDLHTAQVELLASGLARPKGRLRLDTDGKSVLVSDAMNPDERITLASPWSDITVKFRSTLLRAFDKLRERLSAIVAREKVVEAREVANRQQEDRLAAQEKRLVDALSRLADRGRVLDERQVLTERRELAAADKEAQANEVARIAIKEAQRQKAWGSIVQLTKDEQVILAVDARGHVLVRSVEPGVVWSKDMRDALGETPPTWVRPLVEAQQSVRENTQVVTDRLGEAHKIGEELQDQLAKVTSQLTPAQAAAVEQARKVSERAAAIVRAHQDWRSR